MMDLLLSLMCKSEKERLELMNMHAQYGEPAVHTACRCNRLEAVEKLCSYKGLDMELVCNSGSSVFNYASGASPRLQLGMFKALFEGPHMTDDKRIHLLTLDKSGFGKRLLGMPGNVGVYLKGLAKKLGCL